MSGLEDAKPQCGGGAGGAEEEYDLPLHIAALCKSLCCAGSVIWKLTFFSVMVLAASIFGMSFERLQEQAFGSY